MASPPKEYLCAARRQHTERILTVENFTEFTLAFITGLSGSGKSSLMSITI